jgi:hypothetical protein
MAGNSGQTVVTVFMSLFVCVCGMKNWMTVAVARAQDTFLFQEIKENLFE